MIKKEIKNFAKEHNCSIREAQRKLGVEATGNFDSVEKKDGLKKVKLSEIKTPTSVEEFRENLKKYFVGRYDDSLCVQQIFHRGIKYEDINSFSDIYKATGMGYFSKNCGSPHITPLIEYDDDEFLKQYEKNMPAFLEDNSNWQWFHDDYEVYEYRGYEIDGSIVSKIKNPMWFTLDNKLMREFYMHVLGEYAGYGLLSDYAPNKFPEGYKSEVA